MSLYFIPFSGLFESFIYEKGQKIYKTKQAHRKGKSLITTGGYDNIFSARFTSKEGIRNHSYEWLDFDRLEDEYFYPLFLKKDIFHLPNEFTIRAEFE